jgi:hypothetical protein
VSFWCAAMCSTVISDALTSPTEILGASNRIASIKWSVRRPLPRPHSPKRPVGSIKRIIMACEVGCSDSASTRQCGAICGLSFRCLQPLPPAVRAERIEHSQFRSHAGTAAHALPPPPYP